MNELTQLRRTLEDRARTLQQMSEEPGPAWDSPYLRGKAQGVKLAISFLDSILADKPSPDELRQVDNAARTCPETVARSQAMTAEVAAARRLAADAMRDVGGAA